MVRIEAGLIFYGYEFDDQTDPFEAGIGFTVPLKTMVPLTVPLNITRDRT